MNRRAPVWVEASADAYQCWSSRISLRRRYQGRRRLVAASSRVRAPAASGDRWMLPSAAIAPAPIAPTRNQITVVTSEGCPMGAPESRCGTGHTPVNTSGAVTGLRRP